MSFDLYKYLITLGFIYIYGRLIIHYGHLFLSYMLNDRILWRSNFEKPRILFLFVGLSFMHLMSFASTNISSENYRGQIIILMAFSLGLYFSIIPWTDHYKNSIQNRKAVPPLKKDRNFNLTISEDQLHKLYSGLMRHDLLNSEKTNLQDFKNVLTKNWIDHNSKIHFNMDGPSCREFYEYLVKTFPNNTMTLKNLISSKLFIRADGKFYKYNTLKNAPTKTLYSKNYKEMQQIFDKIGGNF